MIQQILKMIWNKRASNALLLLEIFLAFIALFAVYSYLIRNMENFGHPLGFDVKDRWLVQIDSRGVDSARASVMYPLLKKSLSEDPNVEEAGLINSVYPFSGSWSQTGEDDSGIDMQLRYGHADQDIKGALDIEMVAGKWFQEGDHLATITPMVVNEKFINEYYPGKTMVDSVILFGGQKRIIGVIKDYKYRDEFEESFNTGFFYGNPGNEHLSNLILKMKPGTAKLHQEKIGKIVESITGNNRSVISDLDDMRVRKSKASWTSIILLMALCGFLCLNIALGLFGLLWYNIQKRRSEIGLRRAVGAHSSDITTQLILEMVILVSLALVLGVFFAIQVPMLKLVPIEAHIFYKAIAWAFVSIMGIVVLCTIYPSMQAAAIHPASALHED